MLISIITLAAVAGWTPPSPAPLLCRTPEIQQVQRFGQRRSGPTARLQSEHFDITYNPDVVTASQAEAARDVAEQGWKRCLKMFGSAPESRIKMDLSPDFQGATGFARPGEPGSRDPEKQPFVGVRYADLDYLGLTGDYVITHEIAHVFSGDLAGTSLGEGIADWAAGGFSDVPMHHWWGPVLRDAGLWVEPEAFFITGDYESSTEVESTNRTAQYAEAALLVHYLAERFGWEKTRRFAADYGKARGMLNGNEERRRLFSRYRTEKGERSPALPPEVKEVRSSFERHFGQPWSRLLADWEARMAEQAAPSATAERLVLAERIYGTIRNYEMWAIEQRPPVPAESHKLIRERFTQANTALRKGELDEARRHLGQARALVERLRRPSIVA